MLKIFNMVDSYKILFIVFLTFPYKNNSAKLLHHFRTYTAESLRGKMASVENVCYNEGSATWGHPYWGQEKYQQTFNPQEKEILIRVRVESILEELLGNLANFS